MTRQENAPVYASKQDELDAVNARRDELARRARQLSAEIEAERTAEKVAKMSPQERERLLAALGAAQ